MTGVRYLSYTLESSYLSCISAFFPCSSMTALLTTPNWLTSFEYSVLSFEYLDEDAAPAACPGVDGGEEATEEDIIDIEEGVENTIDD